MIRPNPPTSSRSPLKQGPEDEVGVLAVLSHNISPFEKGKCCPFCFFGCSCSAWCLCLFCFVILSLAVWSKCSGATLRIFCFVLVCCFSVVFFFPMFLPRSVGFLLRDMFRKFSCRQVSCSWVHSLFLRFRVVAVCVLEIQLKPNKAHPTLAPFWSYCFSCFIPTAVVSSPVLAVRPFFQVFCRGDIVGPCIFALFEFFQYIGGLEFTCPF